MILITFTLTIVFLSFIFSWFWEKSKSVWSAVILHSAHNSIMLGSFDKFFRNTAENQYVSETGILTIAVLAAIAVFISVQYNIEKKAKKKLPKTGLFKI